MQSTNDHLKNFFDEDVICRTNDPDNIGLITKVGWDSDVETDDDEYSEDEEEEELGDDDVRVFWLDYSETKEKVSNLKLLDRSFLSGDVVTQLSNPGGQSGTVINVHQYLDLQPHGTEGEIIKNVSSTEVSAVHPFRPDSYVTHGDWLGQVIECFVDVEVLFDDGSRCRVSNAHPGILVPDDADEYDDSDDYDGYSVYYPHERVRCASANVFKKAKWISGNYNKQMEGTIVAVIPTKVDVEWLETARADPDDPPANICASQSLKTLQAFDHTNWEIGEKVLYTQGGLSEISHLTIKDSVDNNNANLDNKETSEKSAMTCSIRCTYTFVDVCWQDGSITLNIPSVSLFPTDNVLDDDFWPEDFVVKKDNQESEHLHFGVIKKVNSEERTCTVKWMSTSKEQQQTEEEDVPVYSLIEHPEWSYRLGDIVLLLPQSQDTNTSTAVPKQDMTSHASIGEIIKITDGRLLVQWVDGEKREVGPDEVFAVDVDEEGEDYYYEYDSEDDGEGTDDSENYDDESDEDEGEVYVEGNNVIQPTFISQTPSMAWWQEPEMDASNFNLFQGIQQQQHTANTQDNQSAPASIQSNTESSPSQSESLATFAVVEEVVDNHFASSELSTGHAAQFASRMLHEWELLRENIPKGVFVRVFENRLDLLSLMIIGSKDTPYEDAVFLFDIQIPSNYPAVPPNIHYRSYGEKLNPNLFKDGRVCLSLLGTWSGKGSENWDAGSSNILQVVLSLQGLVLGCSEPYYLEAGYDKLKGTVQGVRSSRLYNETATLLALETIPRVLHFSPPHFTALIHHHFQQARTNIIQRCKNYLQQQEESENNNNNNHSNPEVTILRPTKGFLKSLEKLLPTLEQAFKDFDK